jgi:hypothetical protein
MSKIVVHVDGGIVQNAYKAPDMVSAYKSPIVLIIVDTDTEGCDEGDLGSKLTTTKDSRGMDVSAFVYEVQLTNLDPQSDVSKLLNQYTKDNHYAINGGN